MLPKLLKTMSEIKRTEKNDHVIRKREENANDRLIMVIERVKK